MGNERTSFGRRRKSLIRMTILERLLPILYLIPHLHGGNLTSTCLHIKTKTFMMGCHVLQKSSYHCSTNALLKIQTISISQFSQLRIQCFATSVLYNTRTSKPHDRSVSLSQNAQGLVKSRKSNFLTTSPTSSSSAGGPSLLSAIPLPLSTLSSLSFDALYS